MVDETRATKQLQFDVDEQERLSAVGQERLRDRLEKLFETVKNQYPFIFGSDDSIKLSNRVLAYAVSELRRYSLLGTRTDLKGEAYQELVRDNLRGDRGEFFTPDVVCQMAAEMAFALFPVEDWDSLRILDPACGTGGFLRAAMNVLRPQLEQRERGRASSEDAAQARASLYLKSICERNFFGLDINPVLVRTTQMNMVMHGDGSSNVFQANSLNPPGEWPNVSNPGALLGSMDIVVTNPPFGSGPGLMVDDAHVLEQYSLRNAGSGQARGKMPPEHLFIERCADFLKPGGVLAIVLPDSILSNPGLIHIRRWILDHFDIVASIDLPLETFVAFAATGTQTSVLLLRKRSKLRSESVADAPYDVFMAVPASIGFDRRGNDLWVRTADGAFEWADVVERLPDGSTRTSPQRIRDDQVSEVSGIFSEWLSAADG